MTDPNLWNQLLIWPIVNILVAFYKLFEWLHVPGVMGFAIIGMTAFIRLLLYPLMQAQIKSAKKMSNLKPHLDALNAKHKDDKPKLQQAQLASTKSTASIRRPGVSLCLSKCRFLFALYNVFYQVLGNGNLETLVSQMNQIQYLTPLSSSQPLTLLFRHQSGTQAGGMANARVVAFVYSCDHGLLAVLAKQINAAGTTDVRLKT